MWDMRVCQMWSRMRDFLCFGGRNKTLHSSSCYVPARHFEISIFFSLGSFCYFKMLKKVLNASLTYILLPLPLTFAIDPNCSFSFLLCFPSLLSLPLISLPPQPTTSFHVWLGWSELEYALFLPSSLSLYLLFSLPSSPPSASTPSIPP